VVVLALVGSAAAAVGVDVIVLPRPGFPAQATEPRGRDRFVLVSSRYRDPALLPAQPTAPEWAQGSFRGQRLQLAVTQPDTVLLAYGMDGNSARYLVAVDASTRKHRYALDLEAFGHPPGGGEYEPIVWAWERGGVLYVSHAHLTYASATRNRNGYVSAIRVPQGRLLWRSPALVANSRSFVVTRDLVVSGYGFTAERDFLYALDRRTGRVVDRLAVPTAPETIRLRDGRLAVRTYDHDLVVRLAP
jgi:outer membrane protein assembly factor BamB